MQTFRLVLVAAVTGWTSLPVHSSGVHDVAEPGRTDLSLFGLGQNQASQAGPTPKTEPARFRIPLETLSFGPR